MTQTTTRIWHDCLKEISSVRIRDRVAKEKAIDSWKSFGAVSNLEEGVKVTSLHNPSWPSDERRYWRIPRQCFYGPCVCSLVHDEDRQAHPLRACKGCYRVLYCNERCQALYVQPRNSLTGISNAFAAIGKPAIVWSADGIDLRCRAKACYCPS